MKSIQDLLKCCEHIIWDWNGTLVDDLSLTIDTANSLLEKVCPKDNFRVTREHFREHFVFPVRNYYATIGLDCEKHDMAYLNDVFNAIYQGSRHECVLQECVRETLKAVIDTGRTQSILSAHRQDLLLDEVMYFGIQSYFSDIIGLEGEQGTSKVENGKRHVLSLGMDREKIILVGDTLHDYEVAQATGTGCILIAHGHNCEKRLQKTGVPVIHCLEELYSLLVNGSYCM